MKRPPLLVALLGIVIFTRGVTMMLRFFMGPDEITLGHPELRENAERLFAVAGGKLFTIYAFAVAFGLGAFSSCLTALMARVRAPLVLFLLGIVVSFFVFYLIQHFMLPNPYDGMSDQADPITLAAVRQGESSFYVITITTGFAIFSARLMILVRRLRG